jgi:hypothetical protein
MALGKADPSDMISVSSEPYREALGRADLSGAVFASHEPS